MQNKINGDKTIYISHSWIDSHFHSGLNVEYSLDREKINSLQGISTLIDAGTSGIENFEENFEYNNQTNKKFFYFLNIAPNGLNSKNELESCNWNLKELNKKIKSNQHIIGAKLRYSNQAVGNNQDNVQKLLQEIQQSDFKVMYHIGNEPPKFKHLEPIFKQNDIITHAFHGKNNKLLNFLKNTAEPPMLDIGFGNESFAYKIFKNALKNNIVPTTISTDLHNDSFDNKSCRLQHIMSLCLDSGIKLNDVIGAVTINPYLKYIGEKNYPNYKKTFTAFIINEKKIELKDSTSQKMFINKQIVPIAMSIQRKEELYE